MMKEPIWYKYLVWDTSDPSFPIAKGFKKDTPPEILKAYKQDKKAFEKQQEDDPDANFI